MSIPVLAILAPEPPPLLVQRNAYRGAATHGHPWWWQVAAEIEAALERL